MPSPTIGEIRVDPNPVPAGQQAIITVVAFDSDGREIAAEATVIDPTGQTARKIFTFTVSDPLTFQASTDTGTVSQDPDDPAVFVWTSVPKE